MNRNGVYGVVASAIFVFAVTRAGASLMCEGAEVGAGGRSLGGAAPVLDSLFANYRVYSIRPSTITGGLPKGKGTSRLRITLGTVHDWDLTLEPSDPRGERYTMRAATRAGIRVMPRTANIAFRATLSGARPGRGRLSITSTGMWGRIERDTSALFIEPVQSLYPQAPADLHVVYDARDCRARGDREGDLVPLGPGDGVTEPLSKSIARQAEVCKVAEIAFAADYTMFANYGNADAVENRIVTVFNVVNGLYEDPRINISHSIVEFFVEAEDLNTWGTSLTFSGNLSSLNSWSRSANGFKHAFDVCGLWWYYPGGGTIGIAGISVICSKTRPGHVIRDYTKSLQSQVIDQAHELGHNWGAQHIVDQADIMYPRVLRSNTSWTQPTVDAIVRHKATRTCIDGCNQPPLADFGLLDSSGCRGTVVFVDKSKYGARSWQWDFGDGTMSVEQHPIHNYLRNGTYTVSLRVTNEFGADTVSKGSYVIVNAPPLPEVKAPACVGGNVELSATAQSGVVKWYDRPSGGSPLYVGGQFTTARTDSAKTYYVESGAAESAVQRVGPADTSAGPGGYKADPGHIWMRFRALKNCRLRSITVYANRDGPRHFVLTTNSLASTVRDTVEQVAVGKKQIGFDWDLDSGRTYELVLENTADTANTVEGPETYYNNLYRTQSGVSYPQTVAGLISVTSNYYRQREPTSTGWYIGYDWRVQQVDPCASARVAVRVTPSCTPASAGLTESSAGAIRIRGGNIVVSIRSRGRAGVPVLRIYDLSGALLDKITLPGSGDHRVRLPRGISGTVLFRLEWGTSQECGKALLTGGAVQ